MSQDNDASRPSNPAAGSKAGAGYDTMMGRVVVERGLVSEAELIQAQDRQELDPGASLADALLSEGFVTSTQIDRLRSEIDSERGTQRLPGYQIIRKLGSGAMATVYLAKQISLDRLVAIKVLPRRYSDNADFIERFQKEGRAAAKLNDPNIVAAYDVGNSGDHHYFVMEYVDGETVYDRITTNKRFDEAEAILVTQQVSSALTHAHERGFIHRDIKPKNIMISRDGVVKLADLGLARAMSDKDAAEAEAGKAFGTPFYISPEQIRGKVDIGPQADIYGLGATLYHMVTGRVPFKGKNPSDVMYRHLKEPLVPPDHVNPAVSSGLAQIIEMMMAKNPGDRYRSAKELSEDLSLVAAGNSPRFARGTLDFASVVPQDSESGEALEVVRSSSSSGIGNFNLLLLVGLILSFLLNLALIAMFAASTS